MATNQFNVKILENIRPEAEWLADETYKIIPRESVHAIVKVMVDENGEQKEKLFIRTKVNTTDGKRIFKELKYNDEYIDYELVTLNNDLTALSEDLSNNYILKAGGEFTGVVKGPTPGETATDTELTTVKYVKDAVGDVDTSLGTLSGTVDGLAGTVATVQSTANNAMPKSGGEFTGVVTGKVSDAPADTELATVKYVKDSVGNVDTSALQQQVDAIDNDLTTLSNNVDKLAGTVSTVQGTANNAMPKSGGEFTGVVTGKVSDTPADTELTTVKYVKDSIGSVNTSLANKAPLDSPTLTGTPTAPTAAKGTDSTQIATTQYVQAELASFSGGTKIVLSSTQPTEDMPQGSVWLKIV